MILASVIAWDSFDLEEVFKEKSWIKIIIQNISKDYDLEFISEVAKNILRKEKDLTDVELAQDLLGLSALPPVRKKKRSSLEIMIHGEIDKIVQTITGPDGLFINRDPLTTDLRIDVLKNSDEDFITEYNKINPDDNNSQKYVFQN